MRIAARQGHLEILRDSGRMRMVVSADVEGAAPTGAFVVQMIHWGVTTLATWMSALAAVVVSNRTADELLAEAERDPAAAAAPASESEVP